MGECLSIAGLEIRKVQYPLRAQKEALKTEELPYRLRPICGHSLVRFWHPKAVLYSYDAVMSQG